MNALIKEAYLALAVSILTRSTPEQSFKRLEPGFNPEIGLITRNIPDSEIEEMIRMKESGMSWDEVGETFGINMHSAFKRVKRYKERRKRQCQT